MNTKIRLIDLGHMSYDAAWNYQKKLFNKILKEKKQNKLLSEKDKKTTSNYLIFCEHPHVFTLGRGGDNNNLLISKQKLEDIGATYHHVERGGDITYHGPGQIVVYPVIDMENFFTDIRHYMNLLEEAVIQTLNHYSIPSGRIKKRIGVWIEPENKIKARKICAFGVKTSQWVTLHGLALNVNVNLDYFNYIIPCGIKDSAVTSMEKELKSKQNIKEVTHLLVDIMTSLFGMTIEE